MIKVVVSGGFDPLHIGHLRMFEKAKSIGDHLTVILNSDKFLREKKQFDCMPVNFVRGANWNDKIVIVDEAQNFTYAELLTVLTRIGENSKIIICGDIMQSDIKTSGFSKIFNVFNDEESKSNGIHCVKFTNKDIQRSEILKFIVAKLEENI